MAGVYMRKSLKKSENTVQAEQKVKVANGRSHKTIAPLGLSNFLLSSFIFSLSLKCSYLSQFDILLFGGSLFLASFIIIPCWD
jgi:hypothetical protein